MPEQMSEPSKCSPTPNLAWGPLYFPNHRLLNDGGGAENINVCRGDDDGKMVLASSIISRRLVDIGSVKLTVSGRVLDEDCNFVPEAIVDVWSPDSKGRYSLTPEGECRGAVKADDQGRYKIVTHMPGSYGITAGCGHSLYGTELPPFSLRHIHVAVFAPGHKVMVTQLTFPNDPTRGKDFRELLAPGIHLSDPGVELEIRDLEDGTHQATFDFVVAADPTVTENLFANTTALKDIVCVADGLDLGEPYPLCQAETIIGRILSIKMVATILLPTIIYGLPSLVLFIMALFICKMRPKTKASMSKKMKSS